VSVADRGEPQASCWEWHADGTDGEDDRASQLTAIAPPGRWVSPFQVEPASLARAVGPRQHWCVIVHGLQLLIPVREKLALGHCQIKNPNAATTNPCLNDVR
jgi:hypothetical protein